jgi:hypothetical protein
MAKRTNSRRAQTELPLAGSANTIREQKEARYALAQGMYAAAVSACFESPIDVPMEEDPAIVALDAAAAELIDARTELFGHRRRRQVAS